MQIKQGEQCIGGGLIPLLRPKLQGRQNFSGFGE
jgi:hypothetical protein